MKLPLPRMQHLRLVSVADGDGWRAADARLQDMKYANEPCIMIIIITHHHMSGREKMKNISTDFPFFSVVVGPCLKNEI